MQDTVSIASSLLFYGAILLAGVVVAALLALRNRLYIKKLHEEAELNREKSKVMEKRNQQAMELAHRQGLHTLGTLTSNITHEFNNLLTPIMGYSMLAIESAAPDDEELYDNLIEIYKAARKAKEVISRLSLLNKKQSALLYKFVELDNALKKITDSVLPIKPVNIAFTLDLNCPHVFILADETRLHQMMLNLYINAFQAMEGLEEGALIVSTYESGKYAHVLVKDTGCGIAPEDLNRVLEPFFTTKTAGKGTGLGLAIVDQVVAELRGRIVVESAVGEGTSISIKIPLPGAQAPAE